MINYKSYSDETHEFVTENNSLSEFINNDPVIEQENENVVPDEAFGLVNAASVYIRSGAGKEYGDIATVTEDTELLILGETDEWYNVMTSSGIEGYIMKQYVTKK